MDLGITETNRVPDTAYEMREMLRPTIKQLIREVLEEVKPKAYGEDGVPNYDEPILHIIDEMEAKIKELGLGD